jgi:hypothetical protein
MDIQTLFYSKNIRLYLSANADLYLDFSIFIGPKRDEVAGDCRKLSIEGRDQWRALVYTVMNFRIP